MMLSDVFESVKASGEATVPSVPVKPVNQTSVSSGDEKAGDSIGKTSVSAGLNIGAKYKASVSSSDKGKAIVGKAITFRDVTFGPYYGEIRFRLIHFWEAWNVQTKVLIGLEMILIDEEENVIQGFIPNGRIETYLRHMKAGGTYRLNKFFGSKSKPIYRVAEPDVTISFSWNSVLYNLEDSSINFPEDRFRIHGYREFEAASDQRGDLYECCLGYDGPLLDETEIVASRRVELHVQTHDDPVLKLYLWDKAAFQFCEKFKASVGTARVILVTTLNPKRFGGVLSLSSMASSRIFLDSDVQEARSYLSWLDSNLDVANMVIAEVVTKPELATLGDLFSYMNQAAAKVAWFECTSTIDDVVHGSGWYYIGCGVCHTKATKGPTTLMCKKCGKSDIDGVAQYLSKLSVYDQKDQAVFVLLGDAGEELTGKKAAELVERYYHANEDVGEDHIVPVPQAMIDTIGQTRKFIVKVSDHNLNGKSQTLTVTKVLLLEAPEPVVETGENLSTKKKGGGGDHADESARRSADGVEFEGVKRAKCG
ncbi:BnaC05g12620D [Brassica napus]|uniref:BnaC05g12620D protein n=1 Tax=Brassica napus TaxID=3708 RepID=A0A078HTJ9_BRANA|nr:BnaC05g12620D [Brassica napus]